MENLVRRRARIGCDIVSISRFKNWSDRRVERVFGSLVCEQWIDRNRSITYLAGRWAIAESVFKAIGEWEGCVDDPGGRPCSQYCDVTVTHQRDVCYAFAIQL